MEQWKNIENFPGYQVSDKGRVRTFWAKKHYPTGYGSFNYISDEPKLMSASVDDNGYLKLMLYSKVDGKRYCRKIHRLVAEAFIPKPIGDEDYTIDHILSGPAGKLDNSVENLRWITRRENIQKAYRDGMCDARIKRSQKCVLCIDTWSGDEKFYRSVRDAAYELNVDRSSISHAVHDDTPIRGRYRIELVEGRDRLLYDEWFYN